MDDERVQPDGHRMTVDVPEARFSCGALFAGIGGLCLGFEDAGFVTRWAVEIDEFAAKPILPISSMYSL